MSMTETQPAVAQPSARRRMLVYGNCQAAWLSQALAADPEIAERYEIVYLSDYHEAPANHPVHRPDFLPSCTDAVWQTAAGCKPPAFLASLRSSCRQIRFPTLWLKLLWPMYVVDPRNRPEKDHPWGRYPYGDRLVLKLLQDGVPPADVPKRYVETDLNRIVDLGRFAEMAFAELRFNDRQSDVAIAPFIEGTFRQRKLFGTINHPTTLILARLGHEVRAAIMGRSVAADAPGPADAAEVLGSEETPLHPQIISHFRLAWTSPGERWRYRSEFLTLEEYLRAYAEFRPIPLGEPPDLWLARARQAAVRNEFSEARRLLLAAAARFPMLPHFLQYLGTLLVRRLELAEAEKVLREALSKHPGVPALHADLGVVLLRRNLPAEAAGMFREALRLDPQHKDARERLAALEARRDAA